MLNVEKLELNENKEELLPTFSSDFPYLASRAKINHYPGQFVPWHWHRSIELFYMDEGSLEYFTPKKNLVFPAGSGGFVNSNILHMTKPVSTAEKNIQLLHIFDPILLSGSVGSRIEQKYIMPLLTSPKMDLVSFSPDIPAEKKILQKIKKAFELSDQEFGYEIKIREFMSEIWLLMFDLFYHELDYQQDIDKNDERLKKILIFIHEHFSEKITITELAAVGYLSERVCFRLFQTYLHMSPIEYLTSYRLQQACQMLTQSKRSITEIGYACGFGTASYFGKVFFANFGMTPTQYRNNWQNPTN